MNTFEVYLACLGCGKERILGTVQAEDDDKALDAAFICFPDASEDELHIRPAQVESLAQSL